MTAYKAKVLMVYPDARCRRDWGDWWRVSRGGVYLGSNSKTAFAAWVDAWRNIDAKINQK
jgi:hypothetical protein